MSAGAFGVQAVSGWAVGAVGSVKLGEVSRFGFGLAGMELGPEGRPDVKEKKGGTGHRTQEPPAANLHVPGRSWERMDAVFPQAMDSSTQASPRPRPLPAPFPSFAAVGPDTHIRQRMPGRRKAHDQTSAHLARRRVFGAGMGLALLALLAL